MTQTNNINFDNLIDYAFGELNEETRLAIEYAESKDLLFSKTLEGIFIAKAKFTTKQAVKDYFDSEAKRILKRVK